MKFFSDKTKNKTCEKKTHKSRDYNGGVEILIRKPTAARGGGNLFHLCGPQFRGTPLEKKKVMTNQDFLINFWSRLLAA